MPIFLKFSIAGNCLIWLRSLNSKKVKIDPESYTIEEGKLYLFYKGTFNDTREKWLDNHEVLKPKAHSNWKKIIQ